MNRRGFLIGSVLTPLLARSGSAPAADAARLAVPPPGSDSVADLLQRCKACGQCLSKCPSHLLKRTELGYGLSGAGRADASFGTNAVPVAVVLSNELDRVSQRARPLIALLEAAEAEAELKELARLDRATAGRKRADRPFLTGARRRIAMKRKEKANPEVQEKR